MISVIEDARVETLAIRRFPGLKQLWAQFHVVTPAQQSRVGDWLDRLARALLGEGYRADDPWIAEGRAVLGGAADRLDSHTTAWEIGVQLAHSIGAKKLAFNPRTDVLAAPYRDDNRYFWEFEEFDFDKAAGAGYESIKQVRKYVSAVEMANEIDVETAGDDAQEIWVLDTELFPYEDIGPESNTQSFNALEGKEPMSDPFHYSEWDYQIQLERPAWATVLEKRAKAGDLAVIDDIAARYKREIHRMKFLLDAMQPSAYGIFLIHYVPVLWMQHWLLGRDINAFSKAALSLIFGLGVSWLATLPAAKRKVAGGLAALPTAAPVAYRAGGDPPAPAAAAVGTIPPPTAGVALRFSLIPARLAACRLRESALLIKCLLARCEGERLTAIAARERSVAHSAWTPRRGMPRHLNKKKTYQTTPGGTGHEDTSSRRALGSRARWKRPVCCTRSQ